MIFCSKFIKTMTSSALLAGVASSSFVSAYDTKLRRGMSCNEDKDISSNGSQLENLANKDVTNGDYENLFEDDELDNDEDNRRVHKDNISHGSSYKDTDSVDKVPTVNKHEAEISKLKDNKPSSKTDLLKSLDFKTVASIISASSSIGILSGLSKKLYFDKKVNPTKPDEPEPYIQDDDKNKDNPDPNEKEKKKEEPEPHIKDDDKNKDNPDSHKKEKKKDEPGPSPDNLENRNSNKKYKWITLGFFGFVALVVMFFYRNKFIGFLSRFVAAMYMKYFGVDKFVKNYDILSYNYDECKGLFKKILSNNDFNNWERAYCSEYMKEKGPLKYLDYFRNDAYAQNNWKEVYKIAFGKDIDYDIAEKLIYRHKHDYKNYIEKYPNNWWELYTEDYLKFLEADSEEMNYVVSLILEIYYKNPNLYLSDSFDNFVYIIFPRAADYYIFWFSKLAKEEEIAKSVELSQDGHFLVKDENTGNTVTFKYLFSLLELAGVYPTSNFSISLSKFKIPGYELSYNFFKYFLYIDDPDDAFISTMLIPGFKISEKANEAISSLENLVLKLNSINFENSVKEQLFLNRNKLSNYFKNILADHKYFKTYIKKDKKINGRDVDGEKNLTYDEANDILKAVKSKIENNNNNNNIPKIDSQSNNFLNQ